METGGETTTTESTYILGSVTGTSRFLPVIVN